MFAFGFLLVAAGVFLADSAINNRNPLETLRSLLADPANVNSAFREAKGTWVTPAAYTPPVSASASGDTSQPEFIGPTGPVIAKALAYARAQIGKPYAWGAEGPNAFDCSGLMWAAYRSAGVSIPRTTATQLVGLKKKVSRDELRPGDLIFPKVGHVMMYEGNGLCIEAPRTGVPIRRTNVYGFMTARRVI